MIPCLKRVRFDLSTIKTTEWCILSKPTWWTSTHCSRRVPCTVSTASTHNTKPSYTVCTSCWTPRQLPVFLQEGPPVEPAIPPTSNLKILLTVPARKCLHANVKKPPFGPHSCKAAEEPTSRQITPLHNLPYSQHNCKPSTKPARFFRLWPTISSLQKPGNH